MWLRLKEEKFPETVVAFGEQETVPGEANREQIAERLSFKELCAFQKMMLIYSANSTCETERPLWDTERTVEGN